MINKHLTENSLKLESENNKLSLMSDDKVLSQINMMSGSILDYCTPNVNGEIINQDAKVQEWLNSGKELFIPRGYVVVVNTKLRVPSSTRITGGGFKTGDNFSGDVLLEIAGSDVRIDNVRFSNTQLAGDLKSLSVIKMLSDSHDCSITNCNFNFKRAVRCFIEITQCKYYRISNCKFNYIQNNSQIDYDSLTYFIILTSSANGKIVDNFFECNNDVSVFISCYHIRVNGNCYGLDIMNNHFVSQNSGGYLVYIIPDSVCYISKVNIQNNNMNYTIPPAGKTAGQGFVYIGDAPNGASGEGTKFNISNNTGDLGDGYFFYNSMFSLNHSVIEGNSVVVSSKNAVNIRGYHTLLQSNSITGYWTGVNGNSCIARNNLNGKLSGAWHTNEGNICTFIS